LGTIKQARKNLLLRRSFNPFLLLLLISSKTFSNIMNNNPQSPLQVLMAQSKTTWSGCIEIEEPKDPAIVWNVYLLQGKIQYITTNLGQQERLEYLWQKFKLGSDCLQIDQEQEGSEYVQLCQALSNQQPTEADVKKQLFRFCREGLVNILSIEQTNIELVPTRRINKSVVSFSLEQLGEKLEDQVKIGKYIRGYISSPFSRLYLEQKNALKFYQIWKPKYTTPELAEVAERHKLSVFVSLFVAKNSFYQIATKTNADLNFLAKHLQQSVVEKLIDLLPFKELTAEELQLKQQLQEQNSPTPQNIGVGKTASGEGISTLVACIDDSKAVQKQVKMTLEAGGYQVLSILDPTLALKQLSQQQPAVIFLDINMPNMNGYDLCSLLRKSERFKDIPIVMLTGRDGMIDRVRAKIVGATDYLTKPCDPNKLITLTKVLEKSAIVAS
jgi:twitching motility two-component system response regulator PilG